MAADTCSAPNHGAVLKKTFSASILACIAVVLPLFFVFVRYESIENNAFFEHVQQYYQFFLQIEFMVFVGFGFLMTFLRRYSYGAVGLTYFLSGLVMVLAILVVGMFQQVVWGGHDKIYVELPLLIDATICAASAMIWFGAVIGKATPSQLLWLAVLFVPLYAINQHLVFKTLGALDMGGSISVHAFGAYYGLAASMLISRKQQCPGSDNPNNTPSYVNNIFAMIGTLFLWLYWPSFNSALASVAVEAGIVDSTDARLHANQFYIIINTVISLLGSIITTFATSVIVSGGRFDMVHVQNASLAGGVIMGSACNLDLTPGGALTMGLLAGAISTLGFAFAGPYLERKVGLTDTCGVHNLHGMPGVLGGIAAGFAAFGQSSSVLEHGNEQLWYQLLAVLVTLGISISGGLLGGFLVTAPNPWALQGVRDLYNDETAWLDAEKAEELMSVTYGSGSYGKGVSINGADSPDGSKVPADRADERTAAAAAADAAGEDRQVLDRDSSYHGGYAFAEAVGLDGINVGAASSRRPRADMK